MDGDRVPLCGDLGSRASEHTPTVVAAAAGTRGRAEAEAEAEAAGRRVLRELYLDRYAEGLQVHDPDAWTRLQRQAYWMNEDATDPSGLFYDEQ